jgi:peptidoglycan hydrolase CwlO-like protein
MSTTDVQTILGMLSDLKESQKDLKDAQRELQDSQEEIKVGQNIFKTQQSTIIDLIKGNPLNEDDNGMLGKLKEIDKVKKDVDLLLEDRKKIKWVVGVTVAIGGVIVTLIDKFWK